MLLLQALKAAVDEIEGAHATFLASCSSLRQLQDSCSTSFQRAAAEIHDKIRMATADAYAAFLASAEQAKSYDEQTNRAFETQTAAMNNFEADFRQRLAVDQVYLLPTFI